MAWPFCLYQNCRPRDLDLWVFIYFLENLPFAVRDLSVGIKRLTSYLDFNFWRYLNNKNVLLKKSHVTKVFNGVSSYADSSSFWRGETDILALLCCSSATKYCEIVYNTQWNRHGSSDNCLECSDGRFHETNVTMKNVLRDNFIAKYKYKDRNIISFLF